MISARRHSKLNLFCHPSSLMKVMRLFCDLYVLKMGVGLHMYLWVDDFWRWCIQFCRGRSREFDTRPCRFSWVWLGRRSRRTAGRRSSTGTGWRALRTAASGHSTSQSPWTRLETQNRKESKKKQCNSWRSIEHWQFIRKTKWQKVTSAVKSWTRKICLNRNHSVLTFDVRLLSSEETFEGQTGFRVKGHISWYGKRFHVSVWPWIMWSDFPCPGKISDETIAEHWVKSSCQLAPKFGIFFLTLAVWWPYLSKSVQARCRWPAGRRSLLIQVNKVCMKGHGPVGISFLGLLLLLWQFSPDMDHHVKALMWKSMLQLPRSSLVLVVEGLMINFCDLSPFC